MVGAYRDDDDGRDSGSAYVYRWDGSAWNETKLTATDGDSGDWFGYTVSAFGEVVTVGAHTDDAIAEKSGSAYVYDWDGFTWNETKLTAYDGERYDYYGVDVATAADVVVVSSWLDDDNGGASGSAYVYRYEAKTPGEPRAVQVDSYDGASGELSLRYLPACSGCNHSVVFGPLVNVRTYGYTGRECSIGASGYYDGLNLGGGSRFFLITATDDVAREGSYGRDSRGIERPPSLPLVSCPFIQDLSDPCN